MTTERFNFDAMSHLTPKVPQPTIWQYTWSTHMNGELVIIKRYRHEPKLDGMFQMHVELLGYMVLKEYRWQRFLIKPDEPEAVPFEPAIEHSQVETAAQEVCEYVRNLKNESFYKPPQSP